MLEIEMKFPVPDLAELEARLTPLGARQTDARQEIDHYLNAPDRDFAVTDEALRVRRVGAGNFVTYKGPKVDVQTKTRTEIEVPLAEGPDVADAIIRLLHCLGYRSVATVSKQRRTYQLTRLRFAVAICLDDVVGLGTYAELEIIGPEERLDEARVVLLQLAAELGLAHSERRSYLELLLHAQRKNPNDARR
jgi:adenylate cyclase class 2